MNQAGSAQLAQDFDGRRGLRRVVVREAGVERLARAHSLIKCSHGLFNGRLGIGAMGVKNIHILQPHALEALVQACEQVFARSPVAVRAEPHIVAGLGADNHLVAIGREVQAQNLAEVHLRAAVGRAVVVGQVKVRNAQIEGPAHHGAAILEAVRAAKVVPQPQGNGWQAHTAPARAAILHGVIALFACEIQRDSPYLERIR